MRVKQQSPNISLVILHGWTYQLEKWKPFVSLLEQHEFSCSLLNLPGLTSPISTPWNLQQYVIWLKNQLKSHPNSILVGHSFGGQIAIRFAAQYPKLIKKLVLIDSGGIRPFTLKARFKRSIFHYLSKMGKSITKNDSMRHFFYKLIREQDYYQANPILRETMKEIVSDEVFEDLSNIVIPTTIIWGELDKTTPLSHAKIMHKQIQKSTLHVIAQAKHSPQFTHPQKVLRILRKEIL